MIAALEKYGPLFAAACLAAALTYFSADMLRLAAEKKIDVSELYAAMFDWSSIQTGFLFGVFGFVSGKSTGFMAEAKSTEAMKAFHRYTRTAIVLGFCLTFSSIPLIVTGFDIAEASSARYYLFVAWAFLAIWSFLAFARVAYIFGVLLKIRDKERILG